jgi:hypothetical protein
MPEPKSDLKSPLPSRQILLAADKEELVERIESLQADLQRRMEVEEEILHLNLQKGTASLQTQVEEASRRFKVAQQELEAFRLEILQSEGDASAQAPRPYIYEDLSAPPQEGPDRNQLRGLLAAFRRLRDDRDRLKQEVERARGETAELRGEQGALQARAEKAAAELATLGVTVADLEVAESRLRQELETSRSEAERLRGEAGERRAPEPRADASELAQAKRELSDLEAERDRLEQEKANALLAAEKARQELEEARDAQGRASEEASSLRAAAVDLDAEVERLHRENERAQEQSRAQVEELAQLGRNLAYEQAKSEQQAGESRALLHRLAETGRLLEEARYRLEHPEQTEGFEQLEKFFEKARLKPLLVKNVRSAGEMLFEFVGATIGAQEQPLEGARNLTPRITRPRRPPGLGELRQAIEDIKAADLAGVRRVHDALRASFFTPPKKTDLLTVDLDSLELVVDQRPRSSQTYWPLVLFVPELQEFWHGELRLAPENKPKEIADFVSGSLSRAPSSLDKGRIRFRMDARFYSDAVLRVLEAKKCSYVIAPPDSADLRAAARGCSYVEAGDGWESGEWIQKGRASQVRFVSLRHVRSAQPAPALPFLFRDPQYVYHAFAVDRKVDPRRALETYAAREAAVEREHALLRDVTVNRLLARGSDAHAAFLPLFLLSADLLQWYRRGIR